ncbi:PucR family transcriptional regulator [Mycetocola manganoxydans]|uniref:PucR family transcriptional regulator n=1 Tax=Mycetocola manganoxydans TaxID=699879 RepID=A0A3L6ZMS2_9MICO|nr:PucR family transcriptional regulator [Mycetocola manganoxydans]RLP68841.1 PucR family transcriptional regulator [Mycetocola manganoxydans]GHD51139.1 PucR family transcriptional regulator [Mycetocola manganoxydans]
MHPTVSRLLDTRALDLRLLAGGGSARLTAPISWIHSSDLPDPTPFLDAGQVVLTTGTQFGADSAAGVDVDAYVDRLVGHGIVGVGFGTEVIREGTPPELAAACERAGLPLFEVPYRVPFIAVIRESADLLAAAAHARDTWALNAQRAISFAALRPDALAAILKELSRQMRRFVALVDTRGTFALSFDEASAVPDLADETARSRVLQEAERLIGRGQRSSSTMAVGTGRVALQTLGRRGALRGVLVVAGDGVLDSADQTVVTSVVALTGLALEQNRELTRARARLRSGLFQTLLEGNVALVGRIVRQMGGALPAEPVSFLALTPAAGVRDALVSELEARDAEFSGTLFFAASDGRVIVAVSAADAVQLAGELGHVSSLPVGISEPLRWSETATGANQAAQALARATRAATGTGDAASVVIFSEVAERGIAALLPHADAAEIARTLLRPVREYDAANGTDLIGDTGVWLEHHGQWDPAARALGIHRHTLRNRISVVEKLTATPLTTVEARTNLWLALGLG